MNTDKEQLSAWLDNEAPAPADAFAEEKGFSTTARYQMMGDAMRGPVSDAAMIDIRDRVREAVARESMEPAAAARSAAQKPSFDFGEWLTGSLAHFWKPVGGLAVAASVAMVMVVTINQPDEDGLQPASSVVAESRAPVRPAAIAVPAANTSSGNATLARPALNSSQELNRYVSKHSEFAAQDTVQGMMPYAREVSFSARQKPAQ